MRLHHPETSFSLWGNSTGMISFGRSIWPLRLLACFLSSSVLSIDGFSYVLDNRSRRSFGGYAPDRLSPSSSNLLLIPRLKNTLHRDIYMRPCLRLSIALPLAHCWGSETKVRSKYYLHFSRDFANAA
jgi:hypothetical protein